MTTPETPPQGDEFDPAKIRLRDNVVSSGTQR